MIDLYPLLFEPLLMERPWGGDGLTTLGKTLPTDAKIGESWEIYSDNVIANGALSGQTLRDALSLWGDRLGLHEGDDFPLLVKFLDAREWLSVQVHPNDEQARTIENQPRGKTECWFILHAEPDAQIAYGTSRPMTADDYRAGVAAGKTRDLMAYYPVRAGDFIFVPATTPHAIGPGILLYELQQTSDTTYRMYDWDRPGVDGKPRQLHLDKALAVMDFQPHEAIHPKTTGYADQRGNWVTPLVKGQYFGLDHMRVAAPEAAYELAGRPHVLSVIEGSIAVNDVTLEKGRSLLIPAGLNHYTLTLPSGHPDALVLRAWPI